MSKFQSDRNIQVTAKQLAPIFRQRGLNVSSGALQNADTVAGDGLTITDGVLAVGAGDGIDVAADSVAVDITDILDTSYGLTESSNNIRINLAGAWSGLEFDSGALRVDAGAAFNWTNTHDFDGNVTVTDGADFTVGANIFFVDASGGNVGINCAPDAQFDLDIGGNLRAQGWIVGKHAIQLSGALMIVHFDGPEPYEADFTGNPTGHFGQVATETGGVIYRPGAFDGKGVQIAEATTNLVTNPSAETNTTGWAATDGAVSRVTTDAWIGEACFSFTASAQFGRVVFNYAAAGSTTYTTTIRVKTTSDLAYFRLYDVADTTYLDNAFATGTGDWETITLSGTTGVAAGNLQIRMLDNRAADWDAILLDGVQLEEAAYSTPYCDGSLGAGHAWTGTAHASTSTRTAAEADYDDYASGLVQATGSFLLRYVVGTVPSDGGGVILFDTRGADNNNRIFLACQSDDLFDLYINGAYRITDVGSGSLSAGDELLVMATWDFDADSYTLDVFEDDGTLYSDTDDTALTAPVVTTLSVGSAYNGTLQVNGVVDELVVLDRVLSDDEKLAVYESDAPVFAETSVWAWKTATNLAWADDEGLWAIDADGNAVLGVVGVDSKSWGGQTLNKGDLLIGNDTSYVLWDKSASLLTVEGSITATAGDLQSLSVTGTLTLSGSGEIVTASSGARVEIDTSGVRGYNSTPTQTFNLGADGSGWLGASDTFAWNTTGVIALKADSIVSPWLIPSLLEAMHLTSKDGGGVRMFNWEAVWPLMLTWYGPATLLTLATGPENYGVTSTGGPYCDFDSSVPDGYKVDDDYWQHPKDRTFLLWAWVNADDLSADRTVVSKWNIGNNNRNWALLYDDTAGGFAFRVNSTGLAAQDIQVASTYSESTGTWYFVAGWYDPSTRLSIYIGEASDSSLTVTHNTTSIPASIDEGIADFSLASSSSLSGAEDIWDGKIGCMSAWLAAPSATITDFVELIFQRTKQFYA
uniref:Putative lectin/glucanase superfamily protein n=1 Tax=viral metagenome TaxID=1070528 RepID=A0A6M3KPI7_9ZZZZ